MAARTMIEENDEKFAAHIFVGMSVVSGTEIGNYRNIPKFPAEN